jgi:hypothetical protein
VQGIKEVVMKSIALLVAVAAFELAFFISIANVA